MHRRTVPINWIFLLPLMLTLVFVLLPITAQEGESTTTPEATEASTSEHQEGVASSELVSDAEKSVAACGQVDYAAHRVIVEQDPTLETPHFVIPPNPNGVTLVDTGLLISQIPAIDPVNNTFSIEAFIDMVWCDPRLAFDEASIGWHEKIFTEENAIGQLQLIWQPDIVFVNESEPRETENIELIIYTDGTVEYEERFGVVLENNFDLRVFPFDQQQLRIELESIIWPSNILEFHENEGMIQLSNEFELPEWHWTEEDLSYHVESVMEMQSSDEFSEFLVELHVTRRPQFYLFKVLVPLVLIVILSWSVFWMVESNIAERLGISFTGLLTVVAYQFIIGDSLPRLSYITFMDAIVTYSFALMALTVVENLLFHIFKTEYDVDIALRIDLLSRLLFPLIYVLGLIAIMFVFGLIG